MEIEDRWRAKATRRAGAIRHTHLPPVDETDSTRYTVPYPASSPNPGLRRCAGAGRRGGDLRAARLGLVSSWARAVRAAHWSSRPTRSFAPRLDSGSGRLPHGTGRPARQMASRAPHAHPHTRPRTRSRSHVPQALPRSPARSRAPKSRPHTRPYARSQDSCRSARLVHWPSLSPDQDRSGEVRSEQEWAGSVRSGEEWPSLSGPSPVGASLSARFGRKPQLQ